MNEKEAGKMALDGVVMRAERNGTWREVRYLEGIWERRTDVMTWGYDAGPFCWPGGDFDGWEPVYEEGTRRWAQAQVKQIDPKTGKGKLVTHSYLGKCGHAGWDVEGEFYEAYNSEPDKHFHDEAFRGQGCDTGWSIYEPPVESTPPDEEKVVRLRVKRKRRQDGHPYVYISGGDHCLIRDLNPDHVGGYVFELPDGTEFEHDTTFLWIYPATVVKGSWAIGGRLTSVPLDSIEVAQLAELKYVLWVK